MGAVAENNGVGYERFVERSDGSLVQIKTQDCDAVIAAMREVSEMQVRRRVNTQDHMKLLGSVPNVLALAWANEWGVAVYSKEWLEKTKNRLRNDPNWRLLRAS